jgi:hypothetical protein
MENWKDLWLKNYRGEGDTAELSSFLKKLNYGNRNNISYLPWATVERIFRLQDGTIEVLPSVVSDFQTGIVEADRTFVKEEVDSSGVVSKTYANAYFVNIRVIWQGVTYIERYPLQDSSGRALAYWTQNEINKSIQRGKVKAIAIVSGIGFKLFEDGDLQFEDNAPVLEPVKVDPPRVKPVVKEKVEKLVIVPETEELDRGGIENEIKKQFLSGEKQKADMIREYLSRNSVKRINELSDEDLKTLYDLVLK